MVCRAERRVMKSRVHVRAVRAETPRIHTEEGIEDAHQSDDGGALLVANKGNTFHISKFWGAYYIIITKISLQFKTISQTQKTS